MGISIEERNNFFSSARVRDGIIPSPAHQASNTAHGDQIFEAIRLGDDIIQRSFKGTTSRIGGISLKDIVSETVMMRPETVSKKMKLVNRYHHT